MLVVECARPSWTRLEIGLIPADGPLSQFPAAVLDARITVDDADFQTQFKIVQFPRAPDQKRVLLAGIFRRGLPGDGSIFDRPEIGIAIPPGEIFAVEDWLETVFTLRG